VRNSAAQGANNKVAGTLTEDALSSVRREITEYKNVPQFLMIFPSVGQYLVA
jgi:hypothetical protein